MLKSSLWLIAAGVMLVTPALTVGCGGAGNGTSSRPSIQELKEGLNIVDAVDAKWGFDAAYVKAGHAVYFSSRVGALKPEGYRQAWPDDPPNEMDARYVDENGDTFILRVGGDKFIDPTWAADIQAGHEAHTKLDPVQRAKSFELAHELASALKTELGHKLPIQFSPFVVHATTLGEVTLPKLDPTDLGKLAKPAEMAYGSNGDYNQYYVQQYSGSVTYIPFYPSGCSALPSPIGGCGSQQHAYHTAERFWNYQYNGGSSFWSMYVDACNHGRCAYDGLTYTTGRWGNAGWIWDKTVDSLWLDSPNLDNNGTGVSGACQTSYSWNSGSGSHLCNDDAAFEIWQMDNGGATSNGTYSAWSTATWNYRYTSYYTWSCTKNDSTARYACNGSNVYRDWLPPCPF